MKINWKVRFKNKVWLSAFIGAFIVFGYTMCRLFGVELPIDETDMTRTIEAILTTLALTGVLIDPTTPGVSDSDRAMTYGTDEDVSEYGV